MCSSLVSNFSKRKSERKFARVKCQKTDEPTDQRTKSQVNCNGRLTHEWPIRQKRKKNSFDIGMRKGKLTYLKEGNVISNTVGKEGRG
jgi:hypothetical protein